MEMKPDAYMCRPMTQPDVARKAPKRAAQAPITPRRAHLPNLITGLLCLIALGSEPLQAQDASRFSPLDSTITAWVTRGYYHGAAIEVVRDDRTVFSKTYGGFTADTQVYVASAGKWVAAAVVAAVVDHTALKWDDTVERWLPQFRGTDKATITLRQLLSHTSGIMPYLPDPRVDTFNSLDSAVAAILPLPTVFPAGSRFQYGGLAMQVAGRMAEVATGETFEALFQQYICRPLGMARSHFIPVNRDGGHAPMLAGGLCTTLHDYMQFLLMIAHDGKYHGRRILQRKTVTEMQADQLHGARVDEDEYVERALHLHHKAVYGLGEWREKVDARTGQAYQLSSPGWAGAYPWFNKHDHVWGFFIAHVQGPSQKPDGFSSFYGSPFISESVHQALGGK
jgi:CubicO group peptidase (beta-lactamase class C family)